MPANLPRNKQLLPNAKVLRKNMTKEERHLWYDCLRFCKPRFRRQEIIGNYIADFYSAEAKLVIELDGSQHSTNYGKRKDEERTEFLQEYGIRVLRFKNYQVRESFRWVCSQIDAAVQQSKEKADSE